MAGGDTVEFFRAAPPGGHSCGIICSAGVLWVSPTLPTLPSHPEVERLNKGVVSHKQDMLQNPTAVKYVLVNVLALLLLLQKCIQCGAFLDCYGEIVDMMNQKSYVCHWLSGNPSLQLLECSLLTLSCLGLSCGFTGAELSSAATEACL